MSRLPSSRPVAWAGVSRSAWISSATPGRSRLTARAMRGSWVKAAVPVKAIRTRPRAAVGDPAYAPDALLDGAEDPGRLVVQELSGGGQADVAGGAGEEGGAELLLELADGLRERGLGDVEALGGPAEVAGLRDGGEVAKVSQLHGRPSFRVRVALSAWPVDEPVQVWRRSPH